MFFKKKIFLFYLPKMYKFYIVKAKDESYAVSKLINHFRGSEKMLENYEIIKDVSTPKRLSLFNILKNF